MVNQRAGTVVLSASAGCAELYGDQAVTITDPTDLEVTVDALEFALQLPPDERRIRSAAMRDRQVRHRPPPRWLARQLKDLRAIVEGPSSPGPVLTVNRRRCRHPGWRRR